MPVKKKKKYIYIQYCTYTRYNIYLTGMLSQI